MKRYELYGDQRFDCEHVEAEDGEWVKWEDVSALVEMLYIIRDEEQPLTYAGKAFINSVIEKAGLPTESVDQEGLEND